MCGNSIITFFVTILIQGDVLFQRKKELDLREYDLQNFRGKETGRPLNVSLNYVLNNNNIIYIHVYM